MTVGGTGGYFYFDSMPLTSRLTRTKIAVITTIAMIITALEGTVSHRSQNNPNNGQGCWRYEDTPRGFINSHARTHRRTETAVHAPCLKATVAAPREIKQQEQETQPALIRLGCQACRWGSRPAFAILERTGDLAREAVCLPSPTATG